MKNLLLLFCFAFCASSAFAQIQVVSNGDVTVGDNSPGNPASTLTVRGNGITMDSPGSAANTLSGVDNSRRLTLASGSTSAGSSAFFTMWGDETHDGATSPGRAGELAIGCAYFQVRPNKPVGGFSPVAFQVLSSGNATLSGDLFVNGTMVTSTARAKSNVSKMEYGLEEIMKMNTRRYFYNGLGNTSTDREHFGVIAEEMQKIVPEAVVEYNYSDAELGVNEDLLAVDEGMIKFILINAMQEQQELIAAQADKIAALEDAINTFGTVEGTNRTAVTLSSYDLSELGQNTPNPFNGFTNISYVVPTNAATAQINIFGTNGQLLKSLDIEHIGEGSLEVNAQDLPSGIYSYQLVVDGRAVETNKMVLSK